MKVPFRYDQDVDVCELPEGWEWEGAIDKGDCVLRIYPKKGARVIRGLVGVIGGDVIASAWLDGITYAFLGKFPDTRSASLALVKALGLEVQP